MERLVVVWCPSLLSEEEGGEEVRRFIEVLDAVGELCPFLQPVRLGVCALPARGPSRFFGGERVVVERLSGALGGVLGPAGGARVGVADGLFAALLAARSELIVPPGGAAEFLQPWSVAVLQRPELAATLQRLGVHTLGRFAALPARHVLARFGADAAACHRVARAKEGELPGARDPAMWRRLREVADPGAEAVRQDGFFGGAAAGDRRAAASFARIQRRLGPEAVLTVRLQGGRDPAERVHLSPWDGTGGPAAGISGGAAAAAPWPGRLPAPSPAVVPASPTPVELVSGGGQAVGVTGRGLLTAEPACCSVAGGPWQEVAAWAGPWPVSERWWSSRRRRARLQVVTVPDVALLLAAERGRWWLTGIYD